MKTKLAAMILAAGAMLGAWAADTHKMVQLWRNGPYWQNSRNPNLTQKICYNTVRREHTRMEHVKGK